MNVEPVKKINSAMVVQLSTDELRAIIKDEVQAALKATHRDDNLLNAAQVSEILNCNEDWVYHNARKLPFVRKVEGMLRFSANGLQRYIEARKFTVQGD